MRKRGDGTVSEEVNIDVSADGKLYGIELLNANAQLRAADGGRVVVDDGTGSERAIAIAL